MVKLVISLGGGKSSKWTIFEISSQRSGAQHSAKARTSQTHAKLGAPGMSSTKSFGMIVRGYRGREGIADIARHRRNRERQNLTASASNPYQSGMGWDEQEGEGPFGW